MISEIYRAQADLLLQVIPFIAREKNLALKGGTAINLFIREMPRLSVDVDLTYLPIDSRRDALRNIQKSLIRIKSDIENNVDGIYVHTVFEKGGSIMKLNCQKQKAQIKIEVNTITRGNVFPAKLMQVRDTVQKEFGKFAAINVVSLGELYGSKICAAVDRQHPRDIFDIKLLFENEEITDEIWDGFKVSLISHYKPISELVSPVLKDQKSAFKKQFAGMTSIEFTYDEYISTRKTLIKKIKQKLTDEDKRFIVSFEKGEPEWDLFPLPILKELPAVQWKLFNIDKLRKSNPLKHKTLIKKLELILDSI